jgi:hypothetical protein
MPFLWKYSDVPGHDDRINILMHNLVLISVPRKYLRKYIKKLSLKHYKSDIKMEIFHRRELISLEYLPLYEFDTTRYNNCSFPSYILYCNLLIKTCGCNFKEVTRKLKASL